MSEEREGTPQDFARFAAALRGQREVSNPHPDEGGSGEEATESRRGHPGDHERSVDEGPNAAELFLKHLNTPKPWQAALLRQLHPSERWDEG
jgi:hypothetical protein